MSPTSPTARARRSRRRHAADEADQARQAAHEAAKADVVQRPMSQLLAIRARIEAALQADEHISGGFSVGLDITAARAGWVILTVPTENVSDGQRSLSERLQRNFSREAVLWHGGSDASWRAGSAPECDAPGPTWSGAGSPRSGVSRPSTREQPQWARPPSLYGMLGLMLMQARTLTAAAVLLLGACNANGFSGAADDPTGVERAAVRPAGDGRDQARATGVLRADPQTGCLWLEQPDGSAGAELLLYGSQYRVDFSTDPASVRDDGEVVARVGQQVEVGGGFGTSDGVEGCPVTAPTFLGYF